MDVVWRSYEGSSWSGGERVKDDPSKGSGNSFRIVQYSEGAIQWWTV
jgi:hypothetical protein